MDNIPKEDGNSIIHIIHNASRGGNTIVKKGGKLKEGNNTTISLTMPQEARRNTIVKIFSKGGKQYIVHEYEEEKYLPHYS